jgi:hypothetical protein
MLRGSHITTAFSLRSGAGDASPLVDDDVGLPVEPVEPDRSDVVVAHVIVHPARPWRAEFQVVSTLDDVPTDYEIGFVAEDHELSKNEFFEHLGSGGRFDLCWSVTYYALVTEGGVLGSFTPEYQRARKLFRDLPNGGDFEFWSGLPDEASQREFLKSLIPALRVVLHSFSYLRTVMCRHGV